MGMQSGNVGPAEARMREEETEVVVTLFLRECRREVELVEGEGLAHVRICWGALSSAWR
jgi:hypothetical protein